nr:probable beta-1,3-galactosyltransferase 2 [Ipomoea batatas]
MEDYYGWGNRNRGKMTAENEEFQEEEVWAVNNNERETSPSKVMMRKSSSSWRLPVAPRTGGNERRCRAEQSSAPVAIFELFSQERKTKPTAYYVEHYTRRLAAGCSNLHVNMAAIIESSEANKHG